MWYLKHSPLQIKEAVIMKRKHLYWVMTTLMLFLSSAFSFAEDFDNVAKIQWKQEDRGNGHYYEFVQGKYTWPEAKALAESKGGYLATATSELENRFLHDQVAKGATTWLGGQKGSDNQWKWITDEKWSYEFWDVWYPNYKQPDNLGCSRSMGYCSGEYLLAYWYVDYAWWDDGYPARTNFIIEYEPQKVDEPPKPTLSCDTVKEGQVACYPLDTNANDASGNGNHGTVHGDVRYVPGAVNQASAFDRQEGYEYLLMPNSLNSNEYSVSLWTRLKSLNSHNSLLMLNGTSSWSGSDFWLFTSHGRIAMLQAKVDLRYGSYNSTFLGSKQLTPNVLYFITVIYKNGTLTVYVDGEVYATYTGIPAIPSSDDSLNVGISPSGVGKYQIDGFVDDLRIYNRAITDSEIQTLYNLEQSSENRLTISKTGDGKGVIRGQVKGEERTLSCDSNCQQASHEYQAGTQVILNARAATGFVFKQWSGACNGTDTRLTLTMDAAKNCTVQFEPDASNSALLTVNTDGTGEGTVISTNNGINCGEHCSAYYRLDKPVVLEASANAENLFIGWGGDCAGLKPRMVVKMEAAKNCTAIFNTKPTGALTLSVEKTGEGQGVIAGRFAQERTLYCKASCQQASYDYQAGDQVLLIVQPKNGFIFKQWSGDCAGEETRIKLLMDAAKHCTVQFERDPNLTWHQLTINIGGTGIGSIKASGLDCMETTCTVSYQADETVRLTAKAAPFSQFIGWRGDCEGSRAAQLTITQDLTCTAEFQSEFEQLAVEMVETFCANATLDNGDLVTHQYSCTTNAAAFKEVFWLAIPTLMQVDQHINLSETQQWPTQLNNINELPNDATAEYTDAIAVQTAGEFIGLNVRLTDQSGTTESVPIILYYGDTRPVLGSSHAWYWENAIYFARSLMPVWWW